MVDTATLDGLLKQAIIDKTAEPAFLRALLDAKVYAHVPRHDRNTRVRFIQFTTPDGLTVLPFFSDETQARQAAGTAASIVVLSGRQLLEATRGATLMLNPNTAHAPCTRKRLRPCSIRARWPSSSAPPRATRLWTSAPCRNRPCGWQTV